MKKTLTLSLVLASTLFSAGYQIPNSSINSMALSTANVANAHGADAAYYNPANMIKSDASHEIELATTYVSLSAIDYKSSNGAYNIKSEKHSSIIPSFHYVSKKLTDSGVRVGFSVVAPAGLAREWKSFPAAVSAQKFALETMEFNPSVAIPVSENFSLGFGFRYVRAEGEVQLNGSALGPRAFQIGMNGTDSSSFGYNIALSYDATDAWNISATYRSKITLDVEGIASATTPMGFSSAGASMEVPIPANLIIATAYTFSSDTTVEVTYDRTMWSAIKVTQMNFDDPFLQFAFGAPKKKEWHDTVAYRMGITQKLDSLTLMAGIAYATNAADDQYVSFSSPESDSMTYSIGSRYDITEDLNLGFAFLYAINDDRTVAQPTNPLGVNGTFSNRDLYSATAGVGYKF